ncbi:uncharacterized protein LOC131229051 [Magnolia sinica]|uniref:uncharacterized protein LOC131229051 n=1 Tax=Magnolia sinica TaxID=86752 RepID=UPI00265AD45A|nr:uncharacterized protein LOC131229051 [Magnolia sinica]
MGGDFVVIKPSRSDEVLDADQQLMMAHQIRAHFESMAPKRPKKPNRSEVPSLDEATVCNGNDPISPHDNIPELHRLRALLLQSHPICSEEAAPFAQNEFVETQYYTELNSIDKQHHTTGNGFIRVTENSGESWSDFLLQLHEGAGEVMVARGTKNFRSNPATNEWSPRVEEEAMFISTKPNRSESSS